MDRRDYFCGDFWSSIVSQQSVDLLFDVSKLGVAETGQKF